MTQSLAAIYRHGALIAEALAEAAVQAERDKPATDERHNSIRAEIARAEQATAPYFDAFEQGRLSPERCEERLAKLTARL